MRDLFKKAMAGSMIAGAALLVAACGTDTDATMNNTMTTDLEADAWNDMGMANDMGMDMGNDMGMNTMTNDMMMNDMSNDMMMNDMTMNTTDPINGM